MAAEHREHGTAVPKPQGRLAGQYGKLALHRDFLLEILQAESDITLKELAGVFAETYGVEVRLFSLHRALKWAGLSYKKGLIAVERDRSALRQPAVIGSRTVNPACSRISTDVFFDEMAVETNLRWLRGRALVGERLYGAAPIGA